MDVLTLKQALQETNNILNGISVPMGLFQQIGMPIMSAMGNLNECINAIGDAPAAEDAQDAAEDEPAFREGEI